MFLVLSDTLSRIFLFLFWYHIVGLPSYTFELMMKVVRKIRISSYVGKYLSWMSLCYLTLTEFCVISSNVDIWWKYIQCEYCLQNPSRLKHCAWFSDVLFEPGLSLRNQIKIKRNGNVIFWACVGPQSWAELSISGTFSFLVERLHKLHNIMLIALVFASYMQLVKKFGSAIGKLQWHLPHGHVLSCCYVTFPTAEEKKTILYFYEFTASSNAESFIIPGRNEKYARSSLRNRNCAMRTCCYGAVVLGYAFWHSLLTSNDKRP